MPKYRVVLQSELPVRGGLEPGQNPFRMRHLPFRRVTYRERVWEMEAAEPGEIVRYYREAKMLDLEQVRGFELARIELIKGDIPPCEDPLSLR